MLSSGGVLQVNFYNSQGFPVNVPEGNYPIRFKIDPANYSGLEDYDPSTETVEIPLWYLDEKTGTWRQYPTTAVVVKRDNTAVTRSELSGIISGLSGLVGSSSNGQVELYAVGSVSHFSIINLDYPQRRGRVCGEITGAPPGSYVYTQGKNYNGQTIAPISPDGQFCINVPRNNENPGSGPGSMNQCGDQYRKLIENYFTLLRYARALPQYANDQRCKEIIDSQQAIITNLIMNTLDSSINSLMSSRNLINDQATRTTLENLKEYRDRIRTNLEVGNYQRAFDLYSSLSRVYGENLSAEHFNQIEKEMVDQMRKHAVKAVGDIASTAFGKLTIDRFFNNLSKIDMLGYDGKCKAFFSRGTLKATTSVVQSMIKNGIIAGINNQEMSGPDLAMVFSAMTSVVRDFAREMQK